MKLKQTIKFIFTALTNLLKAIYFSLTFLLKWLYRNIPRNYKEGFYTLLLLNIIFTTVYFGGDMVVNGVSAMIKEETPILIKKVTEYIEVEKIVIKVPTTDAETRYYSLLNNNKVFRDYVKGINVKRNNPGNLRCASQPNSTCSGGFAKFNTIEDGFRALVMQCELDQSRDLSLRKFITKYSPPKENDTEHLIIRASQVLSLEEKELINYLDTIKLSQFMTNQEHSVKIVEF